MKHGYRVSILGGEQWIAPLSEAANEIALSASGGGGGYYFISNTHQVTLATEDSDLREAQRGAIASISDSSVLQTFCRIVSKDRVPSVEPFRGYDLLCELFLTASRDGMAIGLIGGTDSTLRKMQSRCAKEFPELSIAYAYSPAFAPLVDWDVELICNALRQSDVRLLFVGLGCPKQELFMKQAAQYLPSTVMVGVGAAFEFYAGVVPPSPSWIHNLRLEWLYRLCHEPARLGGRYVVYNSKFIYLAAREFFSIRC